MPELSRVQRLVEDVLAVSHTINPRYTHNEHMAWALGILANVVIEKNHMDNVVFNRLHHKLNELTGTRRWPTTF